MAPLAALFVGLTAVSQIPPIPPGTVFRFADREGALHFTDRLGDVPEPYHSMYLAELRELAARGAPAAAPAASSARRASPPPGPHVSLSEQEVRRRARWKADVAAARAELSAATDAVEAAQRTLDELLVSNPTLRYTPQLQPRIAELEERKRQAVARLAEARRVLLEELPARARREGAPPAWLQ